MKLIKDFNSFINEAELSITPANATRSAETFGHVLADYVGKKEEGNNDGDMVRGMLGKLGLGAGNPWCMAFVYAMFDELCSNLGISNPLPKTASVMSHWNSAPEENKIKVNSADFNPAMVHPGQVFIKTRGGQSSGQGHTGIVLKVNGDTFTSIDGNSSDMVKLNTYNIKDMVGFVDYFKSIRETDTAFDKILETTADLFKTKFGSNKSDKED
jgi:hypothetical protein